MEDTLGVQKQLLKASKLHVLILVLMEDTLGVIQSFISTMKPMS